MAEGARLESVFTGNRNAGSNPAPSAMLIKNTFNFHIDRSGLIQLSPPLSPPLVLGAASDVAGEQLLFRTPPRRKRANLN